MALSNIVDFYSYKDNEDISNKVKALLKERFIMQPKAYIHAFGCGQSVADGDKYKGILIALGYTLTNDINEADLILYNTCAIRENAEKHVLGTLGALAHAKEKNPNLLIGVAGCMTEQQHIKDTIKRSYRHVDFVLGSDAFAELAEVIYNKYSCGKRYIEAAHPMDNLPIYEGIPTYNGCGFKAFVPIIYGCNNFCTYCIVPYVRGRERSRKPDDILDDVKRLVDSGVKEITFLGENVNSYGKSLKEEANFADLIRRANDIDGDFIIRYMTNHPKDCSHEFIDTIAGCKKVVRHLHLPVQCGSDRVLKAMNRNYTAEKYLDLVDYIKKQIPDVCLTSDIIVGFPGETYEDFKMTVDLIKKVRYQSLFTFIYSRRKGTVAEKFKDVATKEEISSWFNELLSVQGKIGDEIMQSFVGKTERVLIDDVHKTESGIVLARDTNNIIVELEGDSSLVGTFADVKIERAAKCALYGKII